MDDVTGSIDDVDVETFPFDIGGSRLDGDATLPLEFHGVHGGTDRVFPFDLDGSGGSTMEIVHE